MLCKKEVDWSELSEKLGGRWKDSPRNPRHRTLMCRGNPSLTRGPSTLLALGTEEEMRRDGMRRRRLYEKEKNWKQFTFSWASFPVGLINVHIPGQAKVCHLGHPALPNLQEDRVVKSNFFKHHLDILSILLYLYTDNVDTILEGRS